MFGFFSSSSRIENGCSIHFTRALVSLIDIVWYFVFDSQVGIVAINLLGESGGFDESSLVMRVSTTSDGGSGIQGDNNKNYGRGQQQVNSNNKMIMPRHLPPGRKVGRIFDTYLVFYVLINGLLDFNLTEANLICSWYAMMWKILDSRERNILRQFNASMTLVLLRDMQSRLKIMTLPKP